MTLDFSTLGRSIEVSEAEELLQQVPTTKILDVRTPAEYEMLHIPGSYIVPLDQLPEHRFNLGNKLQEPIILLCRSGARAEQAAKLFDETELAQFHVLRGGINAWEKAGKPVKRGKQRWSMERQVRGFAGALVLAGTLGSLLIWKPLIYLAVFIGGGLTYSAISDTCGMAMLLSKLPYNRSTSCNVRDVVKQMTAPETGLSQ